LAPAIRGEALPDSTRPIYSIRNAFGKHNDCVVIEDTKLARFYPEKQGRAPQEVVFDLAADPEERDFTGPPFGSKRPLLLEAAGSHGVIYPADFAAPDEELKGKLQDIGYLGDD